MRALHPFPPGRPGGYPTPRPCGGQVFTLRGAATGDLPFLRELYADTRAAELAPVPWPDATKRHFLDDQFALQHQHYVLHYADADFLVIELDGVPVGRLYAMRQPSRDFSIVDISLLPAWRGQGIGSMLIRDLQREASVAVRPLWLHVSMHNPSARRLYERLGFKDDGFEGPYQRMCWRPDGLS